MSRPSWWTDVTVGDVVVGYVFQNRQTMVWVAMLEPPGRTSVQVGEARSKTSAVQLVVTAHLRTQRR